MFERFTDRARRVVVLAQEEARMLRHNYIGTEHILLGLVAEGEGAAARVLAESSFDIESVRQAVAEMIGTGAEGTETPGHIPFTPRAKKVLELSLREALQLNHNYIGTEHILLGLIREGEGVAMKILARPEGKPAELRAQVIDEVRKMAAAENPTAVGPFLSGPPSLVSRMDNLQKGMNASSEEIRALRKSLDALHRRLDLMGVPSIAPEPPGEQPGQPEQPEPPQDPAADE
ncbi:Clp protease [Streptosporangiaceae bacterium NEAU-GS5]|nr:Clp protease [Streptosporangiaceae bacterium NEAU-GS5]